MFGKKKKKGANRCSPVFVLWWSLSSPASYSAIETGTNNRLAVFWLFVMFAKSQIKASERDAEYCKNGSETFFGEPVIQAADLEKVYSLFVLGVWGITPPSFFFLNRSILWWSTNVETYDYGEPIFDWKHLWESHPVPQRAQEKSAVRTGPCWL